MKNLDNSIVTIHADGYAFVGETLLYGEIFTHVEKLQCEGDECSLEVALERSLASDTEI